MKIIASAKKDWVNTSRSTDSTGKRLPEPTKASPFLGTVAVQIFTERISIVEVSIPIFSNRGERNAGDPSRGTRLGDSIMDDVKRIALQAWANGTACVELASTSIPEA